MLIWRYTPRRFAMANGIVMPQRRGEMLDHETGEPVQIWSRQHPQTTCRTNAETGEMEQTPSSNIHSERRRPFQVPKKALHSYHQLKHRTADNDQMLELVDILSDSNANCGYYYPVSIEQKFFNDTCKLSPVIFLLPILFLFPFPAWLTVFSIIIELCLHMWTHRTNKYYKGSHLRYRSPLHVLTSQFCALCQSKRNMKKIGKLQDARALKVYNRKPKYCTYVERGNSLARGPKLVYLQIFNEFVNQLTDDELTTGYYQQDGATCNTSNVSMREIESFFKVRIISETLWPPRSPDLTPAYFFLWGLLKGKVYKNTPRKIEQLKDAIRQEIQAVNVNTLVKIFQNL